MSAMTVPSPSVASFGLLRNWEAPTLAAVTSSGRSKEGVQVASARTSGRYEARKSSVSHGIRER
jgi:hypothetical protein